MKSEFDTNRITIRFIAIVVREFHKNAISPLATFHVNSIISLKVMLSRNPVPGTSPQIHSKIDGTCLRRALYISWSSIEQHTELKIEIFLL